MTIYAILAAAILALGFGGGWKTATWRHDAAELARSKLEQRERFNKAERVDQAAEKHEAFKAQAEVRTITITKRVDHVVKEPVYRNVCLPPDGVRIANDAIAGSDASSQPAAALPKPTAAR